MGRSPCCEKVGLKKGPWTPEEDQKLLAYIDRYGHGSWRALPAKAGLQRCGKSCRLRWTNYLRPDIKRGKFSLQEEQTIIQLHALLGNRWSAIATHLPKRTDNEIKNYWNTHLKKRLTKMGIDPVTHKPKNNALDLLLGSNSQYSKHTNLNHMAQWENARLEAEARLVRESKMTIIPSSSVITPRPRLPPPPPASSSSSSSLKQQPLTIPPCLDILKAWHKQWTTTINSNLGTLESPTSVFNFSSEYNNNNNHHRMMTMISSSSSNNSNNDVNDVVQPYSNKSQEIFVPSTRKDTLLHDQFESFSVHNDDDHNHDYHQNVTCINNKILLEVEEEGGGPSFLEGLGDDLLTDNDVDQVFNNMINGFNDPDQHQDRGNYDNNLGGCYDVYYYNLEDDSNEYWNSIL